MDPKPSSEHQNLGGSEQAVVLGMDYFTRRQIARPRTTLYALGMTQDICGLAFCWTIPVPSFAATIG